MYFPDTVSIDPVYGQPICFLSIKKKYFLLFSYQDSSSMLGCSRSPINDFERMKSVRERERERCSWRTFSSSKDNFSQFELAEIGNSRSTVRLLVDAFVGFMERCECPSHLLLHGNLTSNWWWWHKLHTNRLKRVCNKMAGDASTHELTHRSTTLTDINPHTHDLPVTPRHLSCDTFVCIHMRQFATKTEAF
jgi:hypothetical protein